MYSPGHESFILKFKKPISSIDVFRNSIFYHSRNATKEPQQGAFSELKINLVKPGEYSFSVQPDSFEKVPFKRLDTSALRLPKPERQRMKKYRIVVNNFLGGTPARNYTHIGEIQVSPEFKKMSEQIQEFILLHEVGHFYYQTEWKCDLFALLHYLKQGYNASNAFFALRNILSHSPENVDRIERIYNSILKTQKK